MTSGLANVEFDGTTLLTGYALGTFGVVTYVFTLFVRFSTGVGPDSLIAQLGYAAAVFGTPLLAGITAANLVSADEYALGHVLTGYGSGGLIFGVGLGWIRWTLSESAAGAGVTRYVLLAVALTLSVPAAAVVGTLIGRRIGGDDVSASAS